MKKFNQVEVKHIIVVIIGIALLSIFSGMAFVFYPTSDPAYQRWGLYWSLSFPIVLSCFFFYILFQFETKPIKILNKQLQNHLMGKNTGGEIAIGIGGVISELANQINSFLEKNQVVCHELEKQKNEIYTSNKILEYQKKRMEAIIEKVPFGILLMNEFNVVTFANSVTGNFFGTKQESMIGHKFQEWSNNEKVATFITRYQSRFYRTEKMEFTPNHIPGKTISLIACPLDSHKETGSASGTLVVCRDVTSETLAKQARGDFVAHVSHELKSPLNVLQMYSEMLLGESGKSEDFRVEAVNVIYDEVERLGMLVNNLLSISKIEMGSIAIERQRIKPLDLLKDVFESVTRGGKEEGKSKLKLKFKLELPKEMSHIMVDKDMLRVAINNLLTNAIKYNSPQGAVTLSAEENNEQIIFRVEDTGIGIAREDLDKIFDKFFRSENEKTRDKSGHGLGLTLAKNIIELHHGKLLVESEIDKGTKFNVVFKKNAGFVRVGL